MIQLPGARAEESATAKCVEAMEARVLGVLDHVNKKLAEQDEVLAKMVPLKTREQPELQGWTEVVKRTKGGVNKKPTTTPETTAIPKKNWQPNPPRERPLAIMVTKDDKNFPDLIKTIRNKVDQAVTGDSITKMRKTMGGNLLIEINGGVEAAEAVKNEVARSLGPAAKVRRMMNEAPIEIRDLDEETTNEEVLAAVSALPEGKTARLVSLRHTYGDAKTAVVVLPAAAAKQICTVGRIRVGLVYARVRHTELSPRCLRCLAFGHQTNDCKGTDRSGKCWSCGGDGHLGRNCTAAPEVITAFKQLLANSGGAGTRKYGDAAKAMGTGEFDRPRDVGQQNRDD